MMKYLAQIGDYIQLVGKVCQKPDNWRIFFRNTFSEIFFLGVSSLGIVSLISVFMGAVAAIQSSFNIDSPFIPMSMIGFVTRQMVILEFSPTVICLILAGKVGSRIAGEIGTMRVTEQIDAMEVMGVNAANYLMLPKIVACVVFFPVLIILSMGFGLIGAYFVALFTSLVTVSDYINGLRLDFDEFSVIYALVKTVVFAFIIASTSGYFGYTIRGGALDVGKGSTQSVVVGSILIIFFNLILTQLLLS